MACRLPSWCLPWALPILGADSLKKERWRCFHAYIALSHPWNHSRKTLDMDIMFHNDLKEIFYWNSRIKPGQMEWWLRLDFVFSLIFFFLAIFIKWCFYFKKYICVRKVIVLDCGGCCNQIPHTGWFIKNRSVLLTILEAGKSKVKAPRRSFWWAPLSCFIVCVFLPCPLLVEGVRALSGVSLIRARIPFMRAPSSGPRHLPKALPSNTIVFGV